MLAAGVRAVVTCVDPAVVPASFVGRAFDAGLLADLPDHIDPCGERGEFHTFVWDAPGFSSPIPIVAGDVVERDGFVFCDVLPA
jgi:diphthamide synthase (EF-2-diphthine--ammonia ligase)